MAQLASHERGASVRVSRGSDHDNSRSRWPSAGLRPSFDEAGLDETWLQKSRDVELGVGRPLEHDRFIDHELEDEEHT